MNANVHITLPLWVNIARLSSLKVPSNFCPGLFEGIFIHVYQLSEVPELCAHLKRNAMQLGYTERQPMTSGAILNISYLFLFFLLFFWLLFLFFLFWFCFLLVEITLVR